MSALRTLLLTPILLLLVLLTCTLPAGGYSILTHEELIDLTWADSIQPLLLKRYPNLTPAQLLDARAYAYGGCAIQDLGYYPFGKLIFSNLLHYVRTGDFIRALFRDSKDANDVAFAIGTLSHYLGDTLGHAEAINPAVGIAFPNLAAKYGPDVNYAEGRHQHVHTEFAFAIPTYYVIATAEASANLSRFDGVRFGLRADGVKTLSAMFRETRDQGFGAEVKRRILLGTYALSAGYYDAYYLKAQQVRTLLTRDFLAAFAQVDAIVAPITPTPPWKLGEKTADPIQMYLEDIYSVAASLAGICAMSVPCGQTASGLPIGVQIMGPHFNEETMLRVGLAIETAQG
jgi:hypothetical protein